MWTRGVCASKPLRHVKRLADLRHETLHGSEPAAPLGGGKSDFALTQPDAIAADTIWLDNDVFKALTKTGARRRRFNTGATATEANDRIVYNEATDALLYDANGRGGLPAIQFATLARTSCSPTRIFMVV